MRRPPILAAVLVIYFPSMLISLGQGMIIPALPQLGETFDVSGAVAIQVITAQLVGRTVALMPAGALVDRWGAKTPMVIGAAVAALSALRFRHGAQLLRTACCAIHLGGGHQRVDVRARDRRVRHGTPRPARPPDERAHGHQQHWHGHGARDWRRPHRRSRHPVAVRRLRRRADPRARHLGTATAQLLEGATAGGAHARLPPRQADPPLLPGDLRHPFPVDVRSDDPGAGDELDAGPSTRRATWAIPRPPPDSSSAPSEW